MWEISCENFLGHLSVLSCVVIWPRCVTRKGEEILEHSLYYTGWLTCMWWRQLNLNNISYGIPSGPGEDFRFTLFNIFFKFFGRIGSHNWMVRNLEIYGLLTQRGTSLNFSSLCYWVCCIFPGSRSIYIYLSFQLL